jgi:translation initiation factor 3 subunit M
MSTTTKYVNLVDIRKQVLLLLQFENKVRVEGGGADVPLNELEKRAADAPLAQLITESLVEAKEFMSKTAERHVSTWGNLLWSLLRAEGSFDSEKIGAALEVLTLHADDKPMTRLKLLNGLYNTLPNDSHSRYTVFCAMVEFSIGARLAHVVATNFDKARAWLQVWRDVSDGEARRLYELMHRALLAMPGCKVAAYHMLLRVLDTFADEEGTADAIAMAESAATMAIQLPDVHQCDDLLAKPAIRLLTKGSGEQQSLYALLELFAGQDVGAYFEFERANGEFFERGALSAADSLKKIRLLTLATLAARQPRLSFAQIADALHIDAGQVEHWLIEAVSTGLIDAKIDQLSSVAIVSSSQQRVFGDQEWRNLQARLHLWRNNVATLVNIIE